VAQYLQVFALLLALVRLLALLIPFKLSY